MTVARMDDDAQSTPRGEPLERRVERALCDDTMRRIVEAELDPRNFTRAMRDKMRMGRVSGGSGY